MVPASGVSADLVDGLTVQFPTASPHVLTASLGEITATITIEVAAAAEPTPTPTEDEPSDNTDAPGTKAPGAVPPDSGQSQDETLPAIGSGARIIPALGIAALSLLAGSMLLIGRRRRTT